MDPGAARRGEAARREGLSERPRRHGRGRRQQAPEAASPERDHDRHPVETFDFYGFQPNMTVLELAPGEGWFTELLAPALAKRGKLICTSTHPNGPKEERTTFYGQRFKDFLSRSPKLYGKVETLIFAPRGAQHRTRRDGRHGPHDARAARRGEREQARRVAR